MTARNEVWTLLLSNEGQWLTREDIEKVGGLESMRRLREVRSSALATGYEFEQRQTIGNLLEYRLVRHPGRRDWVCTKCGVDVPGYDLQPSTDERDRYRLGHCSVCKNRGAVFTKKSP